MLKSILTRLLVIVSIALVPALGFQAYSENQARQIRKQLVQDEALRLVRLVTTEQQRIIEGAAQVLDAISSAPAVQDNNARDCQRMLANLIRQSPRYNAVAVIGLDGHIRCSPIPVDPAIDLSDRPHFRRALQTGGTVIGDFAIGRVSGKPSIHVARPFTDGNGMVAGVVDLALDLDWLEQQLERVPLPPSASALIADRNGIMLARRPDPARFVGKPIVDEHRFMLEGTRPAIAAMKDRAGNPVLAAYSPPGAEPTGLLVKVSLDRTITFAGMAQEDRTGLVLIIAGGALALVMTALLGARLIRRPLERLLTVADRWRAGELTARTGLRADLSDFGRLAGAFDRMAVAQEARERTLHTALESTAEEHRIGAALAESDARLRLAQEAAGIGIWECDMGSQAISWSPEQYRLYGRDPAAGPPTFTQWLDLVEPDNRASIRDAAATFREPGTHSLRVEFRIRRGPDGTRRWLASLGRLVTDDAGRPGRIVGVNLDITEWRQAEDDARRATALLRAIGTCSPDPIYAKDTEGRLLFVNPAALAVIGKTAEEVIGRTEAEWHDHPEQFAAVVANDRRIIETGRVEVVEEALDATGLGPRAFRSAKAPLRLDDGSVLGMVAVSIDISQAKAANVALRESAERFRAIFEQAAVGMAEVGLDGTWIRVNDRLCDMLGYTRNELLAMTFREVTHPDDLAADLEYFQRFVAGDLAALTIEKRYLHKNGALLWVTLTVSLACDQAGTPQYLIGVIEDISQRKLTESALRESELRFRKLFDGAPLASYLIDPMDASILDCNDAACAMIGYDRDALRRMRVSDIDAVMQNGRLMSAGPVLTGQSIQFETQHRTRSGELRDVVIAAVPVDIAERRLAHVTVIDITERKRAEAALRDSETRLQLAREAAAFGVSDWDLVADTAVWSEEKWRQMGRAPQPGSLDRETWIASLHPEDRERVLGELAASFADPARSYDTEYRVVWPDGTVHWQLVKGKVFRGAHDEAVRLVCLTMDVTERREIEAALRQAQRLDALGRLTGGVAHDFNNLLGVIMLAAESLVAEGGSGIEATKDILDAATRGSDLVRRLLAFARRQPLRTQVLGLNTLVTEAAGLLRRTLPESIHIDLDMAPDLWAIDVDSSQLQDALLNLALNARDAMPEGGRLLIATANQVLQADAAMATDVPPGEYVALAVADTGAGMTREVLERALDPFFTTKALGRGSGLGLPMIYGFARQSGGRMTIDSAPGAGTTVRLLLPRVRENASPAMPAPAPGPVLHGHGRILLVDDNEALRNVAARQLRSLGYDVCPAENGPAALAMLRDGQRFNLLFTDEVMPEGLSGTQLAEAARVIQPDVKVLFTSGYCQPLAPHAGAAFRHMLAKPYRRADLAAKVQEVLAGCA